MSKLDLSALAEQMCRIEHKLDLILEGLAQTHPMTPLRRMDDPDNIDPLSGEPVKYQIDLEKQHVVRKSYQHTGQYPLNIQFSPETPRGNHEGSGQSDH